MRIAAHTLETTTLPDAAWARWTKVDAWPGWMEGLGTSSLSGSFAPGGRIALSWATGRLELVLDRVEDGRTFRATGLLPLARLVLGVDVAPSPMGSRLGLTLDVGGFAAPFWTWKLRERMQNGLATSLRNLARPQSS